MTVQDLIDKLKEFNSLLEVGVAGYEWGYGRIESDAVRVALVKPSGTEDEKFEILVIDRKFIDQDYESFGAKLEED